MSIDSRPPIPMWCFAIAVVQKQDEFLLVHEAGERESWSLPGGRLEFGESFAAGAIRESRLRTGVEIRVNGIVRVEHTPWPHGESRLRVIFTAEPMKETPPRTSADEHSLGAAWYTLQEIRRLTLRSSRMLQLIEHVASAPHAATAGVLTTEDAPYGW